MQIILLHPRFTRARSVTLGSKHLLIMLVLLMGAIAACSVLLSYLLLRHAADADASPMFHKLAISMSRQEDDRKEKYLKENLAMMAVKVGEMQAQMMRLDALGERVQGLAGIRPEEFNFKELPGRGGAEVSSIAGPGRDVGMDELLRMLDSLVVDAGHRTDYLNAVESTLMSDKIKSRLLPTNQPVNVAYNSSSFGWRLDPFTGHNAFHEGLDFPAPVGTRIVAAAAGVVIASEYHYQFGNMLEIDHGNNIITRYAHASQLYVKVGDIVKRGQHVADVGSTGRSTGAHLHFEVRIRGIAQDPRKFLALGATGGNQPKPAPVFVAGR
ncbi:MULTISPECIES: M23 family metallopeptidase [unclassified Herbaspirillum]|uniref:M23 family metallopeptidase n=1 Tax=unclassified Herbaspirillum TaxID=2624150 RepID=UPI0011524A80|nr:MULTISPECIES: M23 family metallopeptidase [unclassified Herbaspirillum]MBB5392675.1 murein DD-endopeptidase MepM/ murein hydrolase activator NlpD [Herbaspirillum sp. SJZ102]TQK06311.1 peptidase M23-like protein [Herbaspirillum sp. SJZ130]TQK12211.1 peptidase M23-like protein [Herbaspirillum sp. SJZ106]TWC68514.1 peptidase M23-like protein [Herbaspirillum sp. SJZ099]